MTRPETCGAAGGAVSMWLRLADGCLNYGGLLTTRPDSGSGFAVYCLMGNLRQIYQGVDHTRVYDSEKIISGLVFNIYIIIRCQ